MLKTTKQTNKSKVTSHTSNIKSKSLNTRQKRSKSTFSRSNATTLRAPLPTQEQINQQTEHRDEVGRGLKKGGLADRLRSVPVNLQQKLSDLKAITFEAVVPPPKYQAEVPRLVNSLRQVIQHEGPVSMGKIDETTPYLDPKAFQSAIPQPEQINWEAIPPFITSSRDPSLYELAHHHGAKFMGSTSSTSPLLSQLHFALTSHAPINTSSLSHWFTNASTTHTRASVKPSINLLRKRSEGIWGIDNAPSGDPKQNQILIDLGKSLERHLTFEWDDFDRIFVRHTDEGGNAVPNVFTPDEIQESEAHAFLKAGHLLLRSQLDCEDDGVPSDKKIFDLKTRATLPIRLDVMNHHDYLDYKITTRHGLYNSFEREYYDMGRSAFLKYSFQCRIGSMGGVFVAYHNTREMFGFEYIPIEKMDAMVYGSSIKANFVFRHSLNLMEEIMARVTKDLGNPEGRPLKDTVRITTDAMNGRLVVFAEKFPEVNLDDDAAVDTALSCPYRGHIYIDWLSEDQARSALKRRGLSTNGTRGELVSRLESACVTPSVLYSPPSEEFLLELMEQGMFKIYNMHINLLDERSNQQVEWSQLNDGHMEDLQVRYNIREVNQQGHKPELARRYHQMLLESALMEKHIVPQDLQLPAAQEEEIVEKYRQQIQESAVDVDGNPISFDDGDEEIDLSKNPEVLKAIQDAKKEYMREVVDHLEIGGVQVPLTRQDQLKISNKKLIMGNLMSQVSQYQSVEAMIDGADKDMMTSKLKVTGFQSNKKFLQQQKLQGADGETSPPVEQAPPAPVHRRAL